MVLREPCHRHGKRERCDPFPNCHDPPDYTTTEVLMELARQRFGF